MATQIRTALESIEGELVNQFPPTDSGTNKYINFYVLPDGGERVKIAVWSNDNIAYSVGQNLAVGERITVKFVRKPNKTPGGADFLNAKDIIRSDRPISNGPTTQSSDMEDPETWTTAPATPKKSHAEKTQESIENQVSAKGAMDYVVKHGSGVFEEDVYLYDKWFFHQQSRIADEEIISVPEATEESPDIAVDEV